MDTSADRFLALAAVQLYGGENVDKNIQGIKGLSPLIKTALKEGLIEEVKNKVKTGELTKTGKPKTKTLTTYRLTDSGRDRLNAASDPIAIAAQQQGALNRMEDGLAKARQEMKEELHALFSAAGQVDKKSPIDAKLAEVTKSLQDLARRIEKLETATTSDPAQVYSRLDAAFTDMSQKVASLLQDVKPPQSASPKAIGSASPSSPTLPDTITLAYRDLCRRVEFEDGLVDIPRLFYKARNTMPGITLQGLQNELVRMWDERTLELHIANEIDKVAEPDMGIWRDDSFYYYVYWPQNMP